MWVDLLTHGAQLLSTDIEYISNTTNANKIDKDKSFKSDTAFLTFSGAFSPLLSFAGHFDALVGFIFVGKV